jgi:hypothetical protein
VKKSKHLHHQQVCPAQTAHLQAMQAHPCPLPRPVIAIPADFELRKHVLQQTRAIKHLGGRDVFKVHACDFFNWSQIKIVYPVVAHLVSAWRSQEGNI